MEKTLIYYDGKCRICSAEMEYYRKIDRAARLGLVDISTPDFVAEGHGLDSKKVQKFMHARRPDGTLVTGVDAFIAIWDVIPGWRTMATVARSPLARPFLEMGYRLFAEVRPYLPKKKSCDDNVCIR
jgi:predicted DCC family thiol-disulfide oxidoreductase YuxK